MLLLCILLLFSLVHGKGFDEMDSAMNTGYNTLDTISAVSVEMSNNDAFSGSDSKLQDIAAMKSKASEVESKRAQNAGVTDETSCKKVPKYSRDYSGACPVGWNSTSYDSYTCKSDTYDPTLENAGTGCFTVESFQGWSDDTKRDWELKCCQYWPKLETSTEKKEKNNTSIRGKHATLSELAKFSIDGVIESSKGAIVNPKRHNF